MKMTVFMVMVGSVLLSGCAMKTGVDGQRAHHSEKNITREGISLPDCATLPDASQADNGSRCWYR